MPEDDARNQRLEHGLVRDPIGEILANRYRVREVIGSGAFAVTYRGWDLRLDRAVAIKILRDTYAINPTFVQRFEREARAAAAVSQGNVVDIYDFGHQDNLFYIVMQYVKGEDLKQLINRQGPLPQRLAAEITQQMLAGLGAIHAAGIIHRDIKPQNVLIGQDGIARVTDFGIAYVSVESGLTTVGTTVGTAMYMAPEQAEAGTLVPATDLYSVGIVLYEMLSGQLPFEAPTTIALALAHIQTPPVPPSERAPGLRIAPEFDDVVMRAMAKRPEERPADAPAMARALSAALSRLPGAAQTGPLVSPRQDDTIRTTPPRSPRPSQARPPGPSSAAPPAIAMRQGNGTRQRRVALLVLFLILLAGVVGGGAVYRNLTNTDDPPDDDVRAIVAELELSPMATEQATEVPTERPSPTESPAKTVVPTSTATPSPTAEPTDTPVPTPTMTPEPTATDSPVPTSTSTPEPPPTDTPEPVPTEAPPMIVPRDATVGSDNDDGSGIGTFTGQEGSGSATLTFTASDWDGPYFQETGNLQPWSAIYAQGTGYDAGSLRFELEGTPLSDTFNLSLDGMTSENWPEVPMAVLVNGEAVYEGASPFDTWNGIEGEQPWTTVSVDLPTSVLQQGENTVTFVNLVDEGEFSRPPYILLAGGELTIELQPAG
jgi:serine/threonine-protein kinase